MRTKKPRSNPAKKPTNRLVPADLTSKKERVLALLKRVEGATLADMMVATGWQSHSVRGYLSGNLRKKLNLNVQLVKREDGQKAYTIA
ncbi:MAG TPA: DUF3489 domain-containing protein [Bryobacteraceae bacterium]|nr:DUF3489 domain-containing protein [Bryobacteraceae bacterium]